MNKFDQFKEVAASRGRGRGRGGGNRGGSRGGSQESIRGDYKGKDDRNQSVGGSESHSETAEDSHGKKTFQGGHERGELAQRSHGKGRSAQKSHGGQGAPVQKTNHAKRKRIEKEKVQINMDSEIKDGLSLYITFKDGPDVYELEKLKGFHSLNPSPCKKEKEKIILFRDMESLIAAKLILDSHKNVKSTNLLGYKSFKKQSSTTPDNCRLYLRFDKAYDEDAVMQLDSKIEEVLPLKDSKCCKVQFASPEEAISASVRLKALIHKTGLRQVDVYAGSSATSSSTKTGISPTATVQQDQVVLRDVPKNATIKDFAEQFPQAVSYYLYDKTFPASKFCHAAIRFNKERVAEILKCKNLKIGGKKVFVFPAYTELLRDDPNLGEPEIVEKFDEESDEKSNGESDEESENVTTVEPPSKKISKNQTKRSK